MSHLVLCSVTLSGRGILHGDIAAITVPETLKGNAHSGVHNSMIFDFLLLNDIGHNLSSTKRLF